MPDESQHLHHIGRLRARARRGRTCCCRSIVVEEEHHHEWRAAATVARTHDERGGFPGVRLDFVWRQAVPIGGFDIQLQFEARNLTNTRYQEFQTLNSSRVDYNTYDLGRSFQFGASLNF